MSIKDFFQRLLKILYWPKPLNSMHIQYLYIHIYFYSKEFSQFHWDYSIVLTYRELCASKWPFSPSPVSFLYYLKPLKLLFPSELGLYRRVPLTLPLLYNLWTQSLLFSPSFHLHLHVYLIFQWMLLSKATYKCGTSQTICHTRAKNTCSTTLQSFQSKLQYYTSWSKSDSSKK